MLVVPGSFRVWNFIVELLNMLLATGNIRVIWDIFLSSIVTLLYSNKLHSYQYNELDFMVCELCEYYSGDLNVFCYGLRRTNSVWAGIGQTINFQEGIKCVTGKVVIGKVIASKLSTNWMKFRIELTNCYSGMGQIAILIAM